MKSADIRIVDLNKSVKDSKFMDLNTTENGCVCANECEVELQKMKKKNKCKHLLTATLNKLNCKFLSRL